MSEAHQTTSRRLPACKRCHSRKTKCDSLLPSCSNCLKAGVECINRDRVLGKTVSRSYILSLEEKADRSEVDQSDERTRKRSRPSSLSDIQASSSPHHSFSHHRGKFVQNNLFESPHQARSMASTLDTPRLSSPFLSCSPSDSEDSPAPFQGNTDHSYVEMLTTTMLKEAESSSNSNITFEIHGTGSSPTLPTNRCGKREAFIQREKASLKKLSKDFLKAAHRNGPLNLTIDINSYDKTLLARLVKRYFTWMNSAHPVLHECVFHLRLEKCCSNPKEASPIDKFQANMVIAISLASISRIHLSISEIGRIAHDFWKLGSRYLTNSLQGHSLEKLQNILLLLQYTLLVPKSGNLWELCGTAMRLATEIGLNVEPNPRWSFDPLTLDMRRRLFWTCYCIDRILATVIGRPTSISENWITVGMPALVEDKLITIDEIIKGPTCQLKVAQIQQIRICQLQSEIHSRLYAPNNHENHFSQNNMVLWAWHMFDRLRLWRSSFICETPLVTKEWTELQYHISVVLLFRPSPNCPSPSESALHVALHSAGEAMKLVKVMHRDLSAVFSWLTMHNLFMCGLTFINSLKTLTDKYSSHGLCISMTDIFLQIQDCSSIMELLSALDSGANERLRNVFELASSNILHNLSNKDQAFFRGSSLSSNPECIWLQIAKSDNLDLCRPVNIDGFNIPLQVECHVLNQFDIGEFNSEHRHKHDTDAASAMGILKGPIDSNLYSTFTTVSTKGNSNFLSNSELSTSLTAEIERQSLNSSRLDGNVTGNDMTSTMQTSHTYLNYNSPNEPNRWSDSYLGAELESWFLYPFVDFSPNSDTENNQLADL